jgi:hypothetical protein
MRRLQRLCTVSVLALVAGAALASPAAAKEAKPSVITFAWYWESQRNQDIESPGGSASAQAPNPYCPGLPSSLGAPAETCAEGRLPVEVINGDYKTPDKISALNFDLTMVPPGSKVSKFTVSMLEAESGCYDTRNTQSGKQCEETDARNIDGKQVQACLVNDIFGEGSGAQYKERPKFKCTRSDPVGKRKGIPNDAKADPNDNDRDHVWKFDLTSYAQKWTKSLSISTSVMMFPKKPKNAGGSGELNWRVVFAGPQFKRGVQTQIVFTPPTGGLGGLGDLPGGDFSGSSGLGGSGAASFSSTSSGGTTDFGSGSVSSDVPTSSSGGSGGAPATASEPVDTGDEQKPTAAEVPKVQAMPAYVWLAILAGLVGFSLLRSFVLEKGAGPRPDGVLAQIHNLNTQGRGDAAAAGTGAGALAFVAAGLGSVRRTLAPAGSKLVDVARKLKPRR